MAGKPVVQKTKIIYTAKIEGVKKHWSIYHSIQMHLEEKQSIQNRLWAGQPLNRYFYPGECQLAANIRKKKRVSLDV